MDAENMPRMDVLNPDKNHVQLVDPHEKTISSVGLKQAMEYFRKNRNRNVSRGGMVSAREDGKIKTVYIAAFFRSDWVRSGKFKVNIKAEEEFLVLVSLY